MPTPKLHRHRPRLPVPRGFTLVELLVALFALSIVAVLSWRGLDGMMRAQSQLQSRADQVLALQAGLAQWSADLDAIESLPRMTALDWDGQALRLVRRSGAGAGPDASPGSSPDARGVVVAAWTRRLVDGQGTWVRWQSPPLTRRADVEQAWLQAEGWARAPQAGDLAGEVRVLPLERWSLSYFREAGWREATPGDRQDTEPPRGPAPLPEGVRLVLTLPPGNPLAGVLTLDWVSPLVRPRRS